MEARFAITTRQCKKELNTKIQGTKPIKKWKVSTFGIVKSNIKRAEKIFRTFVVSFHKTLFKGMNYNLMTISIASKIDKFRYKRILRQNDIQLP